MKSSRFEQFSKFFLREKIAPRSIASKVEIVLETLSILEAQLRKIVSAVVPEQHNTARL